MYIIVRLEFELAYEDASQIRQPLRLKVICIKSDYYYDQLEKDNCLQQKKIDFGIENFFLSKCISKNFDKIEHFYAEFQSSIISTFAMITPMSYISRIRRK